MTGVNPDKWYPLLPFQCMRGKALHLKLVATEKAIKNSTTLLQFFFLGQLRSAAAFFYDLVGTLTKSPKLRNMLLPPTSDL